MAEQDKIKVAIIGASGYSGEELIRLLLRHPGVVLSRITSRQYAGQPVGKAFPRFAGSKLHFSSPSLDEITETAEVAFSALPHGLAGEFAKPLYEKGVKVVDISADFRLRDPAVYKEYYRVEHPDPDLLGQAVYGLPEVYRKSLPEARLVACPGCYPTSVLLPLIPLLRAGVVHNQDITVCSMSGVSGAGRKVDLPYLFPECNESLRPYAVTGHRHLAEIEQELTIACGEETRINFIPHLVPVTRGIHSTILIKPKSRITAREVFELWNREYAEEPFVRILPEGELADTKHVTWTNTAEIGCACDQRTGRLIVSSAIDNLTKGAAGQAVQCMNIMCGFKETLALAEGG